MTTAITQLGPVLVVEAYGGEFVATFQMCGNQAGQLSAVATVWRVDGDVVATDMAGRFGDERAQWSTFLALLPPDVARDVHLWAGDNDLYRRWFGVEEERDALQIEIEQAERYGL
jgi:hypothetical protein